MVLTLPRKCWISISVRLWSVSAIDSETISSIDPLNFLRYLLHELEDKLKIYVIDSEVHRTSSFGLGTFQHSSTIGLK